MEVYSGEGIANVLSNWGLECVFNKCTLSPQSIKYIFTLKNVLDLQKIKKITPNLSALLHEQATFNEDYSEGHFSISLNRAERKFVKLKEFGVELSNSQQNTIIFGLDGKNEPKKATLKDLPHLLIAGSTGSGKTVALNSYILELCCYNNPNNLGLVLIDLKRNEFCRFEKLPHLLTDVVYDSETARNVLDWLVQEMETRYETMQKTKDFSFKTICVVIDELADLVMQDTECKTLLIRLLQKSRACDMHIIISTQSPRAKLLDGLMLANLPARLALTCSNVRESMLILGHKGAEQLQGKGDSILKLPNSTQEFRVQVPFITDNEINKLLGGGK